MISFIERALCPSVTSVITFMSLCSKFHGWHVCKALASHQGDPGSIPGQGHVS